MSKRDPSPKKKKPVDIFTLIDNLDDLDRFDAQELQDRKNPIHGDKQPPISSQGHGDFKLFDFLVEELNRLEKLTDFFQHKLPQRTEFPTTAPLIIETQEKTRQEREILVKHIINRDSHFQRNLATIFDQAFLLGKNFD